MEDRLAQEVPFPRPPACPLISPRLTMFSTQVYYFLVRLPVDDHVLKAFQSDSVSHREIFPLGQPFKSLYAIHALREYLSSRRRSTTPIQRQVDQDAIQIAIKEYSKALTRGMSLTIAAISDYEVIRRCASQELQIFLSTTLVESLVQTLKDPLLPLSDLAQLGRYPPRALARDSLDGAGCSDHGQLCASHPSRLPVDSRMLLGEPRILACVPSARSCSDASRQPAPERLEADCPEDLGKAHRREDRLSAERLGRSGRRVPRVLVAHCAELDPRRHV